MDIFLAEVTRNITGLVMPVWIAVATGVIAGIFATRCGLLTKVWEKRLVGILAASIAMYVASIFISTMLLGYYANKRFEAFAYEQITLFVQSKAKDIEIRDPKVIAELWSITGRARSLSAHHSHPVDKITLIIPEAGYRYSLGRDSEVQDEFWLEWLSYPGSDPAIVSITNVKQFQSRALSDWLKRHGLTNVRGKEPAGQ